MEEGLTVHGARIAAALGALVLLMALNPPALAPVRADTAGEIEALEGRLATLQEELNALVAAYDRAQARHAEIEADAAEVEQEVRGLRARVSVLQEAISARARVAYQSGGSGMLEMLLDSRSLSEFSDRAEFLGRMAREDSDLLLELDVMGESLRRREADLQALRERQSATLAELQGDRAAIADTIEEAERILRDLEERKAAEDAADVERAAREAAELAARQARSGGRGGGGNVPPTGSGPLDVCPTGRPRSFSDTFGDPRPGGRVHQGVDLMAPLGTPVYATQSGQFVRSYNELGGISGLVSAPNGDYTYYAHMSSYASVGSGAGVGAGTHIGYVGDTGNAPPGVYHLHFEYHPGGGGAVDPYAMLLAVC
jgi:murein DD-endopeptidase MepM/ murein hydrolase activator NlpD